MRTKDKYLWIVNKQNLFDEKMLAQFEFVPIRDSDGKTMLEKEAAKALDGLQNLLLEKKGISTTITSGYRDLPTQQKVMDELAKEMSEEELLKTVALPGTSEHHTGLAVDIKPHFAHKPFIEKLIKKFHIPERIAYPKQPDRETKKQMYAAIHEELEQFGFILRYTAEKSHITGFKAEPWHIRYVGVENAKAINASGLCLEEYVEQLEKQAQEESQPKTSPEEPKAEEISQVVIVHPVVNKVFEEHAMKSEEERVQ